MKWTSICPPPWKLLAKKKAKFYTINAIKLASEVGMGGRINTIMQAAFFKLPKIIPYEDADKYMKAYAKKAYGKKGDAVVQKNWDAIDIAISGLKEVKVPAQWANATTGAVPVKVAATEHFEKVIAPILELRKARSCPFPCSTRAAMCRHHQVQRGIAVNVPRWIPRTASNARSALWSARTPASAPSSFPKAPRSPKAM